MTWRKAWEHWRDFDAKTHAAAVSFYAALSLPPLVLILLAISKWIFGDGTLGILLVAQEAIGESGAELVQQFLGLLSRGSTGITIFGLLTLVYSGSKVFGQFKKGLEVAFDIGRKEGVKEIAKSYAISILMMLVMVLLVLTSLILIIVVSVIAKVLGAGGFLWYLISTVLSLGMFTLSFALAFRFVPSCSLPMRDVWRGAFVTAILTQVGNIIIGIIIGKTSTGSLYGIAGALILLMMWIYYLMLVIFFGASYTRVLGMIRDEGKSD